MKIYVTKKNVKYIKYIVYIFALVYSLGIISKPFTSFEKRITIKSVRRWRSRRSYGRKVSWIPNPTSISFTDENNKKYYYKDSLIFGLFSYGKESDKIKEGNSVTIKGYKNYLFIKPKNIVYDVE
jgi:hypothetical protein